MLQVCIKAMIERYSQVTQIPAIQQSITPTSP